MANFEGTLRGTQFSLFLICSSFHKFPQIYICDFSISSEPHKLLMGGVDWIASNDSLQWRKTFQRKLKQLKENLYANEVILRWLHCHRLRRKRKWSRGKWKVNSIRFKAFMYTVSVHSSRLAHVKTYHYIFMYHGFKFLNIGFQLIDWWLNWVKRFQMLWFNQRLLLNLKRIVLILRDQSWISCDTSNYLIDYPSASP